jgi:glycerophosphoryl diester phosphodiesterase
MTQDGVLVVLHDETLDRTARGPAGRCSGPVRAQTAAALEACDFGSWFDERSPAAPPRFSGTRIVTLDALFARFGRGARYYIETKHPEHAPGMEEALVALLERHGLDARASGAPRVILQSFHPESLQMLRARLGPDIPMVQLLGGELPGTLDEVLAGVAAYANGVGPQASMVDEAFMAAARRHGLFVHPYTVNDVPEMERLLDLGVDGLFTDRPQLLIEMLKER